MIVNSEILWQNADSTKVIYQFTDHLANTYQTGIIRLASGTDINAHMALTAAAYEQTLAEIEKQQGIDLLESGQSPDIVAQHQTQAGYDRRILGYAMTISGHLMYNAYPLYVRVRDAHANRNQRADYLNIPVNEWDQIATRFDNSAGVSWFFDDEKSQTWVELPEGYN